MNRPAGFEDAKGGQSKPFGKVERMIAMRYLRAKKTQGGVGLIAGISFTCIALAIFSMIVIMSIMNGFRSEMIRLTIGTEGHMYVASAAAQPVPEAMQAMEGRFNSVEGVEEAFQFTENYTGIQANEKFGLARVIGISPDSLRRFDIMSHSVQLGGLDYFGEGRGMDNQIAMGADLAGLMNLTVGDRVTIFSTRTRSSPVLGPQPIKKTFTVGAIFSTGLFQADYTYIYMSLDQATLLFEDGKLTGEIQVRLDDPDKVDQFYGIIADVAQEPVGITTWKARNKGIATALRTEQIAMRFIFMIVVLIAAFPVLSSMIMLVKNKSKDIAILRTIGATSNGVLRIFFMSGAMIGILGTLVGLILGILFCINISSVQTGIEFVCQCELFPKEAYQLSDGIPAKIIWSEVMGVAVWGFIISALATLIPAFNASKVDPVDALRYE